MWERGQIAALAAVVFVAGGQAAAEQAPSPAGVERLVTAYPDAIDRVEGNALVWRDGSRMVVDDGAGSKPVAVRLAAPDLKDMFIQPYPAGAPAGPPSVDFDPGRVRSAALFEKLYGDCRRGGVTAHLIDVVWLPKKDGRLLKFHGRHGAAARLAAVSKRLDDLPAHFDQFLFPPAGTYNCRPIAGTDRISAHGFGIAIDLAVKQADYWRWAGRAGYRNAIPLEVVAAFEAEGFIWGGRWSHFDTMHFEYRPELLGLAGR